MSRIVQIVAVLVLLTGCIYLLVRSPDKVASSISGGGNFSLNETDYHFIRNLRLSGRSKNLVQVDLLIFPESWAVEIEENRIIFKIADSMFEYSVAEDIQLIFFDRESGIVVSKTGSPDTVNLQWRDYEVK